MEINTYLLRNLYLTRTLRQTRTVQGHASQLFQPTGKVLSFWCASRLLIDLYYYFIIYIIYLYIIYTEVKSPSYGLPTPNVVLQDYY